MIAVKKPRVWEKGTTGANCPRTGMKRKRE
jgi:hypothetical protein